MVASTNRLRQVLVTDKQDNPLRIYNVLKSDVLFALKNYMDISANDLNLDITVDEMGCFNIDIHCNVRRLKSLNAFLDCVE